MFDDMTQIARTCVGVSSYVLQTSVENAPTKVDCSSFTQWLYLQVGIEIPRLARDQHDACISFLSAQYSLPGDLVFRKCRYARFKVCPVLDIGHVGFVTSDLTVIHASWTHGQVVEESMFDYFEFKNRGLWAGRLVLEEMI